MRIVVIGLGSMGKRRVRLIKELYPSDIIYGVDGRFDRRDAATKEYNIKCYESLKFIPKDIDCAFVCTSPLAHSTIIKECLQHRWNVFTELNLVDDGYEENMALAEANGCTLFLSSTFLYREEIRYIRSRVDHNTKWNYVYHIGQYLPDWHPWEGYKEFFIGNRRTNGCREIMAIEFPWLIKTFGEVKHMNVVSDKMTELTIDYDDNYMIQLEHVNGSKGTLIVDVVSPVAVRNLEIYAENRYIQWLGTPDSLREYDLDSDELRRVDLIEKEVHLEGYRAFIVENEYRNEIQEFMEVVLHNKVPLYGFEDDKKILALIDKVEA